MSDKVYYPTKITEILKDFNTRNVPDTPKIRELHQNLQEAAATLKTGRAQVEEYIAAIKSAHSIICIDCSPPIELHLFQEQLEKFKEDYIKALTAYEYEIYTQLIRDGVLLHFLTTDYSLKQKNDTIAT